MAQKASNSISKENPQSSKSVRKNKGTSPASEWPVRTKAQQAGSKSEAELEADNRKVWFVRIIISICFLVIGFFLFLSLVGTKASVLNLLSGLVKGLFGYGFVISPLACVMIMWVLACRFGKYAKLRIAAICLDAPLLGSFIHALHEPLVLPSDTGLIAFLWDHGKDLTSGGVISGCIAHFLVLGISKVGAVVCLFVLLAACILFSFQAPVRKLIRYLAERKQGKIERKKQEIEEMQTQFQLPQGEPQPPMPMRDAFHTLVQPMPKIPREVARAAQEASGTSPRKNRKHFDVPIDDEVSGTPVSRGRKKQPASVPAEEEDDLPFTRPKAAAEKKGSEKRKVSIPVSRQKKFTDFLEQDDAYTAEVQQYIRKNNSEAPRPEPVSPGKKPVLSDSRPDIPEPPFIFDSEPAAPAEGKTADPVPAKKNHWDLPLPEPATGLPDPEDSDTTPISELPAVSASKVPVQSTLTEEDIHTGARAAKQSGSLQNGEAESEAMEVERQITDAESEPAADYHFPSMDMLEEAKGNEKNNTAEMQENVRRLEATLSSFNVDTKIENVVRGPSVTRYEMELKPGTKMNKITSLNDDIALALGVSSVRVAAVTGKSSTIGIEVPNRTSTSVPIRSVIDSREFRSAKSNLAFAVGKDISGSIIIGDIAKMPHLLIAGTTGSGKSVCMNSIIVSLLYRTKPEQCRMIMIDPKVVELSVYNGIPHLLIPVVTDAKKAAGALQWAVTEMERRYNLLAEFNVRDLAGYNKQATIRDDIQPLPQIVVIIDELADLMLVAAKEVENSIVRIAQKARAAGMHLVIATQRPSANVITGLMKANIPSRIAFAVSSAIDSRIILDTGGAEKLLGKGDMLFAPIGSGNPKRVQGCFITDEEVEAVVAAVKQTTETEYDDSISRQIDQNVASSSNSDSELSGQTTIGSMDGDELLPEAVEVVLDTKQASVSMLQRRLRLGYAHAARIVDEMEEKGIVGPFEGSKPRQLLISREQWDHMVGINPKATAVSDSAQGDSDFL